MPKRNVLLLLLITTISLVSWLARDQGRQARQIGEVLGAIERSYLEPVDADLLEAAAVEGIMAKLDEHSALVAGVNSRRRSIRSSVAWASSSWRLPKESWCMPRLSTGRPGGRAFVPVT
jgi:hypothetical protein